MTKRKGGSSNVLDRSSPERAILHDYVLRGKTIESIARARRLDVAEVKRIIDTEAAAALSGEGLRRDLYVEHTRLQALLRKHFDAAMEGDTVAAALYVKTSERLASMTGTNAPHGHAVMVIHATAPRPEDEVTNTQRMLEAVRALRQQADAATIDGQVEGSDKLN
jgi:hypothetical protein